MPSYIGITVHFISNYKMHSLCWLADDGNPQS